MLTNVTGTLTNLTQKISAARSLLANPASAPTTQSTDGGIKGADDQGIALMAPAEAPVGAIYSSGVSGAAGPRLDVYLR
jgi:hypothetical protein